jgi:hypothetical protein
VVVVVGRAGCFFAAACGVGGVRLVGLAAAAFAVGRAVVLTGVLVEVLVEAAEVFAGVLFTILLWVAERGFGLASFRRDDGLAFVVEAAWELFFADFVVAAAVVMLFVALRTGAFSAPERLASGLGRVAAFAPNLGFFAGEALEPLRATGREDGLFVLLLTDSLMRSSIIKMAPLSKPRNARSLSQPVA